MSFIGQCFGSISDCFYGTGGWDPQKSVPLPTLSATPDVFLDATVMGHEAVIVKNGSRLCGTGAARASNAIQQNKAYWEVKIQQSGIWSCGLATGPCDMNKPLGTDNQSWVITSENVIQFNGEAEYTVSKSVQEGDILGFTYDHVELNFFLNGTNLNCPILGIKGTVFPVLYVDDGAILDAIFDSFRGDVPPGFDRIMIDRALL